MATAGSIVVDLLMRTGSFETDSKRAEARLKSMEKTVEQWSKRVALGAAAAGAAFSAWTLSMTKSMDATLKMAQQIGTTTEALTGLRYATQQFANVSDQTFDMSLRRMTRRIAEAAEGSGAAKGALTALGLSAKELADLSVDEQFLRVAEAMKGIGDQGTKLRSTMAIFDTEGMPLVTALSEGRSELEAYVKQAERFGVVVSTEAARAASQLQSNLDQLNAMAKGVSVTFANELLPKFADFSSKALLFAQLTKEAWEEVETLQGKTKQLSEFTGLHSWFGSLGMQLATTMDEIAGLRLVIDGTIVRFKYALSLVGVGDRDEATNEFWRHQQEWEMFDPRANRDRWKAVNDPHGPPKPGGMLAPITVTGNGGGSFGKPLKLDEGQRYIQQLQERVALLGLETEHEQLLARIKIGSLKFVTPAMKEQALALAKQLDDTQKQIELEEILRNLRQQQSITQLQFMRELESFGQGDRVRQLNADLAKVEDRYRSIIDARRNSPLGLSDEELAQIRESLQIELDMVREFHEQKLALQKDWTLGASDALANYADEAANVYDSVGSLTSKAFKGMEDSLTEFVRTGKLSFSDLADSIIRDMIRIAVQQSVTGPLAGAAWNFLANVFNPISVGAGFSLGGSLGGSFTPTGPLLSLSSGGYTGDGGKYEPAGIVHRGEGVLNQDEIRALGGESGFNALRRALRTGHASGGMAGRPSLPPAVATATPEVHVVINNNGQQMAMTQQPKVTMDAVRGMVVEVFVSDTRVNGPITRSMRGAIGV